MGMDVVDSHTDSHTTHPDSLLEDLESCGGGKTQSHTLLPILLCGYGPRYKRDDTIRCMFTSTPDPGIEPASPKAVALAGSLFTTSATWDACDGV